MLRDHDPADGSSTESYRLKQCQLASTFEHVSQHYDRQSNAADYQTHASQHQKNGKVGVLHLVEPGQSRNR